MMNKNLMEFEFDNPNRLFLAGSTVNGVLNVNIKPDEIIDSIDLVFFGVSFAGKGVKHIMLEAESDKKNKLMKEKNEENPHNERENKLPANNCNLKNYLNNDSLVKTILSDNEKKGEIFYQHTEEVYNCKKGVFDLTLGDVSLVQLVGRESFEFCIPVPNNLPPSIETDLCFVRYILLAVMEVLEGQGNKVKASYRIFSEVSINMLHDLNSDPKATLPKTLFTKNDNCLGCLPINLFGNSIQAQLQILRRAFVPGEFISSNVVVTNRSSSVVLYVKLSLMQIAKFSCGLKYKRKLVEHMRGSIAAFGCQLWRNERMRIPPVPCSASTSVLKIKYKIQLEIFMSGVSQLETDRSVLKIPVVIGNLPLNELTHLYKEGVSDLIKFRGPHYPLAESQSCVAASKMDGHFVPNYIVYELKDSDCDTESVFEITS